MENKISSSFFTVEQRSRRHLRAISGPRHMLDRRVGRGRRNLYRKGGPLVYVRLSFFRGHRKSLHNGVFTRHIVPTSFFLHTSRVGHREDVPGTTAASHTPRNDLEEGDITVYLRCLGGGGGVVRLGFFFLTILRFIIETVPKTTWSFNPHRKSSDSATEERGRVEAAAM